jgi:hypothetical protein
MNATPLPLPNNHCRTISWKNHHDATCPLVHRSHVGACSGKSLLPGSARQYLIPTSLSRIPTDDNRGRRALRSDRCTVPTAIRVSEAGSTTLRSMISICGNLSKSLTTAASVSAKACSANITSLSYLGRWRSQGWMSLARHRISKRLDTLSTVSPSLRASPRKWSASAFLILRS